MQPDIYPMPIEPPTNIKSHQLFFDQGETFEAPGVSGRMDRTPLAGGGFLYRLEFKASEDCELNYHITFTEPWLGLAFHLQGHSVMLQNDGQETNLNPDNAVLMRVDMASSAFRLTKGVLIRHVGVSMSLQDLESAVGSINDHSLQTFRQPYGEAIIADSMAPTKRMQKLASSLFSSNAQGLFYPLKLEGVARLLLAAALEQYSQASSDKNKLSVIESEVFKKTTEYIQGKLSSPISIERLAEQHDLNNNRLNWIFKQQTGTTVADYIRNERLNAAHTKLLESSLPVKQIALQVGYEHTGNFSRAYKKKFGESPSRTQQK